MPAIHDPKINHEPMFDAVWLVPSGELAEPAITKPVTARVGHIRPDADHHETPQRAPATSGAHDPSPNGSRESQGQRSRRGGGAGVTGSTLALPSPSASPDTRSLYFPDQSVELQRASRSAA